MHPFKILPEETIEDLGCERSGKRHWRLRVQVGIRVSIGKRRVWKGYLELRIYRNLLVFKVITKCILSKKKYELRWPERVDDGIPICFT